jgi:rhodanese-related sulfurtransferase
MGGAMNLGVGIAFTLGSTTWAYVLGGVLIALQLIVITTHFCVASWMYELLLRSLGQWKRPIAVDRIRELLGEGGVLIDVRSPAEFARGHAPDARNIPLDDIPAGFPEPGGPYLLYCMSGLRSQRAALLLAREGRADIYNVGAMSRLDALGG